MPPSQRPSALSEEAIAPTNQLPCTPPARVRALSSNPTLLSTPRTNTPYTPFTPTSQPSSTLTTPEPASYKRAHPASARSAVFPPMTPSKPGAADESSNWRVRSRGNSPAISVMAASREPQTPSPTRRAPHSLIWTDPPPRRRTRREADETHDTDLQKEVASPPFHLWLKPAPNTSIPSRPLENKCTSCGVRSTRLSIINPCLHIVCSSCLTGSLNVVGDKGMECMTCHGPVEDFVIASHDHHVTESLGPSPMRDPFSSDMISVLRIDNLPWDITPPAIEAWVRYPVIAAHILLDRKDGRSISHGFVELSTESARLVLRRCQNTILGSGRRARPVTVTMSSQEELLRNLFPTWKGTFDGDRPSLSGLQNHQLATAVHDGLLSFAELDTLLHLIRTPNSHFLKVPSLPFYLLISILRKFPSTSRHFWSLELRDRLFAVALGAIQVLASQVELDENLFNRLTDAALECKAFTSHQLDQLTSFVQTAPSTPASVLLPDLPPHDYSPSLRRNNQPPYATTHSSSFHSVADEFGIGEDLVIAVAKRFAGL